MTDSKAKARILNPFELDKENLSLVEFMNDISNQENFLQWQLPLWRTVNGFGKTFQIKKVFATIDFCLHWCPTVLLATVWTPLTKCLISFTSTDCMNICRQGCKGIQNRGTVGWLNLKLVGKLSSRWFHPTRKNLNWQEVPWNWWDEIANCNFNIFWTYQPIVQHHFRCIGHDFHYFLFWFPISLDDCALSSTRWRKYFCSTMT